MEFSVCFDCNGYLKNSIWKAFLGKPALKQARQQFSCVKNSCSWSSLLQCFWEPTLVTMLKWSLVLLSNNDFQRRLIRLNPPFYWLQIFFWKPRKKQTTGKTAPHSKCKSNFTQRSLEHFTFLIQEVFSHKWSYTKAIMSTTSNIGHSSNQYSTTAAETATGTLLKRYQHTVLILLWFDRLPASPCNTQ